MFKKTPLVQVEIFNNITGRMSDRKIRLLEDPGGWHNVFHREVIQRIDEDIFSVLFSKKTGRPNASIKVLVGMMILKEGNGWSDEQLFDECRFNLKVMVALGLVHLDDDVPVESTYYEFRRRLSEYNEQHGDDLLKHCFKGVTSKQIEYHNVIGEKIRMDSKLIQSNIARSTRLELILEAIRKCVNKVNIRILNNLSPQDLDLLEALQQKKVTNITYPLDNMHQQKLLKRLGFVIGELLAQLPGNSSQRAVLERIFHEQYQVPGNDQDPDRNKDDDSGIGMKLKPSSEISTSSMQSVHDPEAAYRSKGHGNRRQQVSGYHVNVTETCEQSNAINLITDVQVAPANISENDFLLPGIKESNQVLQRQPTDSGPNQVNHVTTDAGYDSAFNRKVMGSDPLLHWNMSHHKGLALRYKLSHDQEGKLQVWCKKTNAHCEITYSNKAKKYIISHKDKTRRYLTKQQLENYHQIQEHINALKPEDLNIRPNVESTVHHMFHRLDRRFKIRYRGLCNCNMYVLSRALWVNFRRIWQNEIEMVFYTVLLLLRLTLKDHKTHLLNINVKSGN